MSDQQSFLSALTRPDSAQTGSAFIDTIRNLDGLPREQRITAELKAGNLPRFLRKMVPVRLTATDGNHTQRPIEYYVTPDYLAVGSDADFVRIPVEPATAQQLADSFGCLLPTARMVEQIYTAAAVVLPDETRNYWKTAPGKQGSSEAYLEHSQAQD